MSNANNAKSTNSINNALMKTIKSLSKNGLVDYLNRQSKVNRVYTFSDLKKLPKNELLEIAKML